MISKNIKPFIPYRVTKDSTDKTLHKGDIVWLSDNGDLNIADPKYPGWLAKSEWSAPRTSDFEIEPASEYEILCVGRHEICRRKPK